MDGRYTAFINDDRLVSTFGIRVDDAHNRLWVVVGDVGASEHSSPATTNKLSAVAAYNPQTGERLGFYDLTTLKGGAHLANDVAFDGDGNAYITDSYAAVIYRISNTGSVSIFAETPLFRTGEGFGLNGIVCHPDGYLLVGTHNTGEIFKISIDDPSKVEQVKFTEPLMGADGITLVDGNHLAVTVNSGVGRVISLASEDGWISAKVVKTEQSVSTFPTSATVSGKDVWVLNSRLDTLFDKKAEKASEFFIQRF